MSDVSRETPPPPPEAAGVFAARLSLAEQYAALLAGPGTERGLLGPREVPRLWDRHLLNCAVVTDLVPAEASVVDVGSGAGLPGLVMAIRRPDLRVTLLEPLLRRTRFLEEAVSALGLESQVEVLRGRAEDVRGTRDFDVVTSRAVAPLERLLPWSLPLARRGGLVLALKGDTAADELEAAAPVLRRLGGRAAEVVHIGPDSLSFPTTVVRVEAGAEPTLGSGPGRTKTGTGRTPSVGKRPRPRRPRR
jgi:16S rRNA (guanine527-N7)-methyltransferase